MRIGELAKRSKLTASRIRFYETQKLIPKAVRAANGYREYRESTVTTLRLIDDAQKLGFSLHEIRKGLTEAAPHLPSRKSMHQALQHKLASIDQHIAEARTRRREIIRLIKELECC